MRMVVLGTRESRLGPVACGVAGSDARPITGEPGKWHWVVERQSERVVVVRVGKAGHMAKGPYFIDARDG